MRPITVVGLFEGKLFPMDSYSMKLGHLLSTTPALGHVKGESDGSGHATASRGQLTARVCGDLPPLILLVFPVGHIHPFPKCMLLSLGC